MTFERLLKRARLLVVDPRRQYLRWQREYGTFCFIHINKCGGTSVERALNIPVKIHDTALQRRERVGRAAWDRMFKFSIVRHPFDKACSHYRYRVKKDHTGLRDQHLDLNQWVEKAYGDRDPKYYNEPLMFAPCHEWVSDDDGNVIVDFVAKLEQIDEDWKHIRQGCQVDAELTRLNATKREKRVGRDALNERSRKILRAHFAKDFDTFGYET